ncbi:alkaline phosphatase synthesis sensor protein PhoR [Clostridium tepidiprofundi DSM 19306]|uniref:histidine kinase n=1 Tax=Clostridium tepidiprofundi DSM 19306 TaxID=1121338 RepID=A0A151B7L7_9CLOT|nr:ATP-binding protein [Clostridium tepidiprofundi]KYH35941.1 alkaline phosphatase synthesis sensor protein PhoR [Clostridium tepidiprofundi DSM 19306]
MRKKLTVYILTSIILFLFTITSLLTFIFKQQYQESVKSNLKDNNEFISNLLKNENYDYKKVFNGERFKNFPIRITFIDNKGTVLFDSSLNPISMENHGTRPEVISAIKYGEGYNIRYSKSIGKDMIYCALRLENGYIIRSSLPMNSVSLFNTQFLKEYIFILCIAIILAIWFSSKLAYIIVKPIKDLDETTTSIASGNLDKRVRINSNDELGKLAENFNYMAEKLQESINEGIDKQNRLRAILTSMDSGVIAIDRKNKIIMINPYAEKIFGIDQEVTKNKNLDTIQNIELKRIFKEYYGEYNEIKIYWPKERILRIKTTDIINRNEHIGTVAVVQDITDLKKLEQMRTQFVANVSHELKTPLTSIKGFSETLKDVEDSETRIKFLNIINQEAERLTRLINDILILSRIEQQRDINTKEEVNVNKIILDVYNLLKNTAEKKNISLVLQCEKVNNLIGDSDKFKQMVINLVDNGIKYSESGDCVTIGVKEKDGKCIIWVKDTGVGIPEKHISRLFERFYRVDKARSRAKGGTGLGLAIVKHIVILFKGTIEVESKVGKGSKFTIKIPY